jgi:hypothetical protein
VSPRCAAASLFALLLVTATPAFGQTAPSRLQTLDIGLGLSADANHALFHDFWDPGVGVELHVAVPLYGGRLRAGVQQFHNDAVADALGFRSRYFHLAFEAVAPLAPRIAWRAGPEVGIYHMWFDDPGLPEFTRSESEFAVGAASGVDVYPLAQLGVSLQGRYQLVLTEQRIHRVLLGVALTYRTGFPAWLRGFLH